MDQEFRSIPLDELRESKSNPRRHFDAKALEDLTESVKARGILVPLLVRPMANGKAAFEILAGARRFRAAQAAGLETVPALVRELDDAAALEVMIVDNLQREDVHPLEEALGYQALIDKAKYDVASIAAKVGKSISYVYQRLKLSELVEDAQDLFLEGEITAGHAILIARLQEADQKRVLKDHLFENAWVQNRDRTGSHQLKVARSVRELAARIESEIHLDLAGAAWPKEDAELVAEAGPCTTCPKRTGTTPELFPDIARDTCTDPTCFRAKASAWAKQRTKEVEATGEKLLKLSTDYHASKKGVVSANDWKEIAKNAKACSNTALGIVVEGRGAGRELRVCTKKYGCRTHSPGYRESSSSSSRSSSSSSPKAISDRKIEELKLQFQKERRRRVFREIFAQRDKSRRETLNAVELQLVADRAAEWLVDDDIVAELLGWKPVEIQKRLKTATAKQLCTFIVGGILSDNVESLGHGELLEFAKSAGVNTKAIDKEIEEKAKAAIAELKAAQKKRPKDKPKKMPAGGRRSEPAAAEASA